MREALRGDRGEQLCGHITGREVGGLRARVVALLDNPMMPTQTGGLIPWPGVLTFTSRCMRRQSQRVP